MQGLSAQHRQISEDLPVDAIVVLAGGDGERIARALELLERQLSSTLVVSRDGNAAWGLKAVEARGEQVPGFQLVSFAPSPCSTEGEARAVAALATRYGWKSIALVTSSFHMRRAAYWFRLHVQCDIHPNPAPVQPRLGVAVRELAATASAIAKTSWRAVANRRSY